MILCAVGEGLWGLGGNLVSSATVLPLLLKNLGMGQSVVGLVGMIESLCGIVPQMLGSVFFRGYGNLRTRLVFWHVVYVVPFLGVMGLLLHFSAHLPPGWVATGLLVCWGGFFACISVIVASWIDWLGQVFSPRIRGTVLGLQGAVSAAAGGAAALLAGWLVSHDDSVPGYARHYFLATGMTAVSMGAFYLMKDNPAMEIAASPEALTDAKNEKPGQDWPTVRAAMAASFRDMTFRGFLVARSLGALGFAFVPFMTLHYASPAGGSLSDEFVVSCGAIQAIGMASGNLALGRLGDTRGHRAGLMVGAMAQCAALLVALLVVGKPGCLAAFALAGVGMGANAVAHLNLLLETCPHEQRQAHITAGNVAIAVPTALAPLLAGLFAEAYGPRPIFVASLLMAAAAAGWIALRLVDPRTVRTVR